VDQRRTSLKVFVAFIKRLARIVEVGRGIPLYVYISIDLIFICRTKLSWIDSTYSIHFILKLNCMEVHVVCYTTPSSPITQGGGFGLSVAIGNQEAMRWWVVRKVGVGDSTVSASASVHEESLGPQSRTQGGGWNSYQLR